MLPICQSDVAVFYPVCLKFPNLMRPPISKSVKACLKTLCQYKRALIVVDQGH